MKLIDHLRPLGALCAMLCIFFFTSAMPGRTYAVYYNIEKPKFSLNLSYELDNQKQSGGENTKEADNTSHTYIEKLDITTGGWIVYPKLLKYSLRLSPEWEKMNQSIDDNESSAKTFLLGYSLDVMLLPDKPYSLNLFANRSRSTVSSTLAEKNKTESNVYAAFLNIKYKILPTILSYRFRENSREGFFSSEDTENKVSLKIKHDKYLGISQLTANYSDLTTSVSGKTTSSQQQSTNLANFYEFKELGLNSGFNYNQSESSSSNSSSFSLSESLKWEHTDAISSSYNFGYSAADSETVKNRSATFGFNIGTFQYRDVSAFFSANGSTSSNSGRTEDRYGTGTNLNYEKDVPGGDLRISASHTYSINKSSSDSESSLQNVVDEALTLTIVDITTLENEDVVVESIIVTDETGAVEYKKDIHYTVTQIGSLTRISRIPAVVDPIPPIPDGATVLVDYTYQAGDPFDFSLFSQSYRTDLNMWSAWRTYYSYNQTTQKALSDPGDSELADDTTHMLGTDLEWKWTRTGLVYKVERGSKLSIDSLSINENISLRPLRNLNLNFSGTYRIVWLKDTGEVIRSRSLASSLKWRMRKNLRLNLRGFYNGQTGEDVKTSDIELTSLLQYNLGIWQAALDHTYANSKDLLTGHKTTSNIIMFKISRALF